jgi:hypothetical protein
MSLDERIALTMYDRMYQVITGTDPASGMAPAFKADETMFLMAQKGMAINPADYRNPWSPGNTEGSIQAAFNIAALVDEAPSLSPTWSPSGQNVSDVYSKMVKLVHVVEPPPSPEDAARRESLKKILIEKAKDDEGRDIERPTALADGEQKAFNNYQDAYMAYVAAFAAAQADPALKGMWPIVGAQALQRPKRAFADWGAAGRDQVDAAKKELSTLNGSQVARAFGDAQFRLTAYELVNGLTETFYRTTLAPTDWADGDGSNWPEYHFHQSTLQTDFSAEATSWGAAANVSVGLWSFGGGVSSSDSRSSMSNDTTNVGITFRWRVCPVYRKWMDGSLFKLPNWDLGTLTGAGGISGAPNALMPLIPIAVVIARDIRVEANWSHQDRSHIESAISGSASVGYGPFAVSGSYSHSSADDHFHAEATDQGFTIPAVQVIGYVCLRVPQCPPK